MTPVNFRIPVLPDVLPRPRLYRMLSASRHCRIILMTGQAAQGKSTLTADYLNRENAPSLWFHLGPSSSDSGALFDQLSRGLGELSSPSNPLFLNLPPSFPHAALGTRQDIARQTDILVSALNRVDGPLNLVLDDMESLAPDATALDLIQALLSESPGQVRFFLLSRTLPGLNLSRFKMNRTLMEVTNEDLAFTLEETRAFFSETAGGLSTLAPSVAERVLAATSGWAGGMVLVAEAVRRTGAVEDFPGQISSEVFSYFSQEIYKNLPPETREFLRQAALFEELDTQMLSKIFPETDPVDMLNRLERRNLFIQKTISRIPWPVFRYNNLFREFLLEDLGQTCTPGEITALNHRIGQALWEDRAHEKAIPFLMTAGDHDMVAKILKIKGADYIITGRTDRLARWINALPVPMTQEDPWLIFFNTMADRIRGGKKNIQAFTRTLALFREQNDTRGILLSLAYLIEASVFIRQPASQLSDHIRCGEQTLADLGGEYRFTWARILLWQQIGLGYIAGTGEIPKGISACRNAILLAQGIENPALIINASVILTLGLVQSGDFAAARDMLEKTRAISLEESQPEYRALESITNIDLALKRGDIGRAGELLDRSEADIEKFGLIFLYPGLVEARALYYASSGRYDQAISAANHLFDFSVLSGNDFYQGICHRIKSVACLLNADPSCACDEALQAIQELVRARRGQIHIFQARHIYGTALYSLGKYSEALQELTPVLAYFRNIQSGLSLCETAFILGCAVLDCKEEDCRETAARYFTEGLERAMENRYVHFPLLDAELLAEVVVRAWETLDDPEQLLLPFVKDLMKPSVLAAVRDFLSRKRSERFIPLFRAACPGLFISTLGPFSVLRGYDPIEASGFGGAKPLMLLKVLLLNGGQNVPKEVLMEALWPDSGENAGEKNLKINLHRLRKALEPFAVKQFGHVYLSQKAGRISLSRDLVRVDTTEFASLAGRGRTLEACGDKTGALACYARAVALYKGEYFSNDPYLEGTVQDREMYQRTCIDLLERSAGIYEERDLWQESVDAWLQVLSIDACHESAYQHLMALYGEVGMKTEALQVYDRCCRVLGEELDLEPAPKTRKMYDRLAVN